MEKFIVWTFTHGFRSPVVFRTLIYYVDPYNLETISPVVESCEPVVAHGEVFFGSASYYSHAGCVGCSEGQIMANGKPFNESALTVAFNHAPLGTFVEVTNMANNLKVIAEVTDTGGFNELGRIIDLSKGTKEYIGCTDICAVKVEIL
jgi:rare lipoprotein A (peptidoglycan hydrolase)